MEQILQKNKKSFPVWNIIKKMKMVYNFRNVDEKHSLIQIDNEKKLYLYDDEHKGELITTLQMYLRNNQSIKKTADAMFVHYRTISYRIEKIKQISGINFDNANEVLAVSNGLIIYKMLKEIE